MKNKLVLPAAIILLSLYPSYTQPRTTQSQTAVVYRMSPLHLAARAGNVDKVKSLLNAGVAVDAPDPDGSTALMLAAQKGHTEIVNLLLKKNASPDLQDKRGNTPLLRAVWGYVDIVKLLLKYKANPNVQNENGVTPLAIAAQEGHAQIVTLLLQSKADPNTKPERGATPLHFAVVGGHAKIVSLLLGNKNIKPNPDLQNTDGETPLYIAADEGHTEIVSLLLNKNAKPDLWNNNNLTPINIAAAKGHIDTVKLLLANKALHNVRSKGGWTALGNAVLGGHVEIVKLLLEKGADPSAVVEQDGKKGSAIEILNTALKTDISETESKVLKNYNELFTLLGGETHIHPAKPGMVPTFEFWSKLKKTTILLTIAISDEVLKGRTYVLKPGERLTGTYDPKYEKYWFLFRAHSKEATETYEVTLRDKNRTMYLRANQYGKFGPQTGPLMGLKGKTKSGLPLKNNITCDDVEPGLDILIRRLGRSLGKE